MIIRSMCVYLARSALEPVVYDFFLVRSKTDNKELEAQLMVIVQTLLKLVRYNKVIGRGSDDRSALIISNTSMIDSSHFRVYNC